MADKDAINFMRTLLRFTQYYCNSLLTAEANNVLERDDEKLLEETFKATQIFLTRCDWLIEWASRRGVMIFEPYLLTDEVAGIVVGMVDEILVGMNL